MTDRPQLSVIVITHNREDQVVECVLLLSRLEAGATDPELIVVLDSCSDRSLERLSSLRTEIGSRLVLESIQANSPAVARNRGVDLAHGSILVFLDDDVRPSRELLDAHLRSQQTSDVVIGYLSPGLALKNDWWQLGARIWWEDRFTAMRQPGYVLAYHDLFSANFSVKSSLFRAAGGFDKDCPRLEDYELGIRLLKAGASFSYNPKASVVHMETGSSRRWLDRASLEALGELHIGRKHPDIRKSVFQDRLHHQDCLVAMWKSRFRAAAFRRNALLDMSVKIAGSFLPFLESIKAWQTWRNIMGGAFEYNYWMTIARHFETESQFLSWVDGL